MTNEPTWGPFALQDGLMRFQIWAPAETLVSLELEVKPLPMMRSQDGWHRVEVEAAVGSAYRFILSDGRRVADPASRQQQLDLNGPSILTDSNSFPWQADGWRGRAWEEAVIYEIHVGAFTEQGTFRAAAERIAHLAQIGITAIEIMPLAHFPGKQGWGYDGVLQFAPHAAYGPPDDLRRLVDAAHRHGMMVFLDVVYNHFGPEGNSLPTYAPQFFRPDVSTPWGAAIDFRQSEVRSYFVENVLYWLKEFRLDGLRFDAIDQIEDGGDLHILEEIAKTVRSDITDRHVHLITENPANSTDLLAPREGGRYYKADWNDDFHHAMHVAVTGEDTGYYEPFSHEPWEKLRKIMTEGYFEAGKAVLGGNPPPSRALAPTSFIHFLQNHDQVGNRAKGDRLHLGINRQLYRALVEILMLSPQIPMLFMGDDHLSLRPFHFFADYQGKLAKAVRDNRPKEAANFGGVPDEMAQADIPDPNELKTFTRSKLNWNESDTEGAAAWGDFLRRLISVRQRLIVPLLKKARAHSGTAIAAREGCLFLDWQLGSKTLQLRANLSNEPVSRPQDLGDVIYESATADSLELPAFFVTVALQS